MAASTGAGLSLSPARLFVNKQAKRENHLEFAFVGGSGASS
jgi:hypothetical protein